MQKIIILTLFIVQFVFSQELDISKFDSINLTSSAKIFKDKNSKESIESILLKKTSFKVSKDNSYKLGFTKDTLWFKIELTNKANITLEKVIYVDKPIYNAITVYKILGKEYKQIQSSSSFKRLLNPNINLILKSNETATYLIKIKSDISALNFKLYLNTYENIYYKEILTHIYTALFLGTLIAFIFYNLALSFLTKEIAYFYYSLYFSTFLAYYSYYTNMYMYILTTDIGYLAIYFLSLLTIFILLFSRALLHIINFPKIDISFKTIITVLIFIMLITNKEVYPLNFVIILLLSVLVYVVIISFYLLYKGNKQAKYFVIGWSLAIIGYISFALDNYGVIGPIEYIPFFYELTIFIEALLFSMALANKLNRTKELENSIRQNELLSKELHHRVKNNMQFIISIYRLKLNPFISNDIDEKLKEIERIIQSMSKTHELLYGQKDITKLDTKKYITLLIDESKKIVSSNNILITQDIDDFLDINQSIFCAIILNELITNAIKHAFEDSGTINISLRKDKGKHLLIVQDNGKGFIKKDISSNKFGLLLVQSLVEQDLKGKFSITSDKSTKIKIIF